MFLQYIVERGNDNMIDLVYFLEDKPDQNR